MSDRPPDEVSPDPDGSVWHAFLLRTAARRITGMAEQAFQPRGLTMRHFGVLTVIDAEPGRSQRDVGERLRIDRTTVVALTDDLENAGLLERRRGSDRRMFALHLTERGRTELAELQELAASVHARFLANLTRAERESLRQLLVKVLDRPVEDVSPSGEDDQP